MAGEFLHQRAATIRFGDLDIMGHANNLTLLRLFETGRIDYVIDLGLARHDEPTFTLAAVHCEFKQPAMYGEKLICGTTAFRIGRSSLVLAQRISKDDDTLVCEGSSVIVAIDPDSKRSRAIPDEWIEKIEKWEGAPVERTAGQTS